MMSTTDYTIYEATKAAEERIKTFKGSAEQQAVYEDLIRKQLTKTVDQIRGDNVTLIGEMQKPPEAVKKGFVDAAAAFESFKGVVVAGTQQMSAMLSVTDAGSWLERQRQMLDAQRQRGGFFQQVGVNTASLPTQTRQTGGPVSAGSPYLVGERGPEYFVPDRAGTVMAHGAGGVSISVPITINGSVLSDEHKIARAVGDAMVSRLRGMGVRFPAA